MTTIPIGTRGGKCDPPIREYPVMAGEEKEMRVRMDLLAADLAALKVKAKEEGEEILAFALAQPEGSKSRLSAELFVARSSLAQALDALKRIATAHASAEHLQDVARQAIAEIEE